MIPNPIATSLLAAALQQWRDYRLWIAMAVHLKKQVWDGGWSPKKSMYLKLERFIFELCKPAVFTVFKFSLWKQLQINAYGLFMWCIMLYERNPLLFLRFFTKHQQSITAQVISQFLCGICTRQLGIFARHALLFISACQSCRGCTTRVQYTSNIFASAGC